MKNPGRNNSNLVEYKSTKRKKESLQPATAASHPDTGDGFSYRDILWPEQKKLGGVFKEAGKGAWPVLAILDERVDKKTKDKEYLVEWFKHPETGEVFRPQWVPADSVGEGIIDQWKQQKRNGHDSHTLRTPADAQSAASAVPRARITRAIPDSSSEEPGSHQEVVSTNGSSITKSRSNGRRSLFDAASTPSASIEIAETQPLPQSAPFVVNIPHASIDPDDYESLHSSQIQSDGRIKGFSSSSQSQPSLQLGSSESPLRRNGYLVDRSSSKPSQHSFENGLSTPPPGSLRTQPSKGRRQASSIPKGKEPSTVIKASPLSIRKQPAKPATGQHLQGSGTASGSSTFTDPRFIPSTQQDATQGRQPSEELGSSTRQRRVLSVSELIGDSLPEARYSQVSDHGFRNGAASSPWDFPAHVPSEAKATDPPRGRAQRSRSRRSHLAEGFSSPIRSRNRHRLLNRDMVPSPGPSPGPRLSPPGSVASEDSPFAASISVARNAARRPVTDSSEQKTSGFGALTAADDMDLSGGSFREEAGGQEGSSGMISQSSMYDTLGVSALPIQKSIEEEQQSSNGEQSATDSKASSSQQSVDNERDVPQVDGLVLPSLPILGPSEYAIGLPCEGKIQSTYNDIIKAKRKAILRFLNRHESIGSSNGSPSRTQERNEMNELIQRLHDTTTHMDLGLPGFSTQYSIDSAEHAAYANYAGSKFSFLGHLVDTLKNVGHSIVVVSQAGAIQDLLEQYLAMKHVTVRRQDRIAESKSPEPDRHSMDFQVELVSTFSTHQVAIYSKPILMIAFDASFESQDPQIARIRSHFSDRPRGLLPVIHLLVANSSEHVDRCLPKSIPSPVRLKLLVRATYQARPNLGGKPTYVPHASDEPEGRPMDFSDLQRALRKSPERKLTVLANIVMQASLSPNFDANWTLGLMSELQLSEIEDVPLKASGTSTVAETPKEVLARSRTPISRADTPSGKKRLLEIDGILPALTKRQRLTPLQDSGEANNTPNEPGHQILQLQDLVKKLQGELEAEREARQKAEDDRGLVQDQLDQWKKDHADLQRRYEKRMTKCHDLGRQNTKLLKTFENNKARQERVVEDNLALKKKNSELQAELGAVRAEVKEGGGDAAAVEVAKEEARTHMAKSMHLEKTLENTRKDFEFTRSQYQEASNKAAEFAVQVQELEVQVQTLTKMAGDEKRRLKETNFQAGIKRHLAKISELELECKSMDVLLRKLEEENRQLKRNRGVQTRGSSVQPPGSPGGGMDGPAGAARGTRSRQGSPAPASGLFPTAHHAANRGSLLRHER